MTMTNERIEALTETLVNDAAFAAELFEMDATAAAKALAAEGFDFSAEELKAFSADLQAYLAETEELNENDLEGVNGGCRPCPPPCRPRPCHPHRHYHYGRFCGHVHYRRCRW